MTVSHFIKTSFPPAALKCHKRIVRSYYFLRFLISNVVITLRTSLKTITWSCWSTFAKSRSRKEIQIACIYFPCSLKKKKKKKSVADNKPLEENPSPGKAMKDAFCGYFLLHTWSCQLCLIFFPPLFDLPGAVSCCLNSVKLERRLVYW